MSRASEGELGALHGIVARYLAEKLQSGEASASDVANAIKLLKDNAITASVEENKDLDELNRLLNKNTKPDNTDLSAALEQLNFLEGKSH